jgi:uncharacterized protein YbaP (TraB family)
MRIKRDLFSLIALASLFVSSQAAQAVEFSATAAAAAKAPVKTKVEEKKKPSRVFMWKATAPDGKSAYLVGSIHMVPPDVYPLPAEMEKNFNDSAVLVLEFDDSKLDPNTVQDFVQKNGIYSDGDNLNNHLSKDTAEALKKWLQTVDARTAMVLPSMKPWLAGMTIELTELTKRGFDPKHGIDKHFLEQAQQQKKAVEELESADFQMKLLSSFTDDLSEVWLKSSLVDAEKTGEDIQQMLKAWQNGDAEGLNELITRDDKKYPELKPLMQKLLYDRNPAMADKVEGYIKSGKQYFVVVGAGHLVGPKGIVELLKARDYKVEQVSSAQAPAATK